MQFTKLICTALFLVSFGAAHGQEPAVKYTLGDDYNDRYKYSTVLNISDSGANSTVLVRTYYGGMILRPKGYFIEVYDKDLNLIADHNYKYSGKHMIDGFVKNGQLYLLELVYNWDAEAYEYKVHQSPLSDFNFTEKTLLSIPSKEVANPVAVNKFSRNFDNGFSTSVIFDDKKTAFAISVSHRKGSKRAYSLYLYGTDLKQHLKQDFSTQIETKNYAFENIAVSKDLSTVYLMGKAYFRKRRMEAKERRFQYELVQLRQDGYKIQEFNEPGRFPESLKPLITEAGLSIIGFYADRKDKRYNGLVYFEVDPASLNIRSKKYNAFSAQFMLDKFGREGSSEIKNLIFKDVHITPTNDILFSAEEYFVTTGQAKNTTCASVRTERYHYNDIVCAKLDANGTMQWARNINKAEVTQGDAAYASYTAFGKGSSMYFFINSGENPQKIGKNRILFKQGYSRYPNMFVIQLDADGEMSYKKLIDDKEVRLPIMVSKPLIGSEANEILFYAKRGNRKQLVKVAIDPSK